MSPNGESRDEAREPAPRPRGRIPSARALQTARRVATLGPFAVLFLYLGSAQRAPRPEPTLAPASLGLTRADLRARAADTLARGGTLDELIRGTGLSGGEVARLVDLVRPYENPRRLRPGVVAHYEAPPGGTPDRIALVLDADRTLHLSLHGASWRARLDSVPVQVDTVVVTGDVTSNLYSAALGGDADRLSVREKGDLAYLLSRVYEWRVDFYRDVRPGDAFRVAMEREVRPDGSVRVTRVLAAEYRNADRILPAYRFQPSDELRADYYDIEGEALRGAFLRAPLDYARVTSRFTERRYHPVLRRYRAHRGVDYGAPSGTPIRVTGDGTVARAGWWGDYGLMVEVRHAAGIRTRYAHLSSIAEKLRPGRRVTQGQTIGRVGSTGLSTAPHLHYEFLLAGRQTDPTRVDLPLERPISDADTERFDRARAAGNRLLARHSLPGRALASLPGRAGVLLP